MIDDSLFGKIIQICLALLLAMVVLFAATSLLSYARGVYEPKQMLRYHCHYEDNDKVCVRSFSGAG